MAQGTIGGDKWAFKQGSSLELIVGGNTFVSLADPSAHSTVQLGISTPFVIAADLAAGAGLKVGSYIMVGRNTSGSGAAGAIILTRRTGSLDALWSDGGILRIDPNPPTENDTQPHTGGTIVGTQTSSRDAKDVIGDGPVPDEALAVVLGTRVSRFRYKPGHGIPDEDFIGIITDEAPLFGMDRDAEHPHGKSLNVVNAVGLLISSVQALAAHVERLEARVEQLEARGDARE